MNISRKDLVVVSIMPCLAKKYECTRPEFAHEGNPDVDYSLSTRELAHLIKQANIEFVNLLDEDFDNPMGESTGASIIFGTTGGVIEAAVRSAYELYTGKKLPKIDFEELRGFESVRQATIDLDGFPLKIGIAHGLGNARKLLEDIRDGKCEFHGLLRVNSLKRFEHSAKRTLDQSMRSRTLSLSFFKISSTFAISWSVGSFAMTCRRRTS